MSLVCIQRSNDIIWVIPYGRQECSCSPTWPADSLLPIAQGFNAHMNQSRKLILAEVQAFTNIPDIQGIHNKNSGWPALAL